MSELIRLGKHGEIDFDADRRHRWGLEPGAEVLITETPNGLLLRPADPPLSRVYLEPTSLCNLNCRTCVRHSWEEPGGSMPIETYRKLVDDLRAVPTFRKISFWGFGEPLLHPQIVEMVRLANSLGAQTEIITNGLLLEPPLAHALVSAGLDTIVFSIDGASAEAYDKVRTGGNFGYLQENAAVLRWARDASRQSKPEIGIEFVAMRSNVQELPSLRQLALDIGASFIVVSNVLPYTKDMVHETLYDWAVGTVKAEHRNPWLPQILLPTIDTRREAAIPLGRLTDYVGGEEAPLRAGNKSDAFCKFVGEGAVAVGWDGRVSPCVALMHSYTCYVLGREKQITRCTYGDLAKRSISEVWNDEAYRAFRARVQNFEFSPCVHCGGCHHAEGNKEDCYGNPFPVCGDCLWARGAIQCP